MTDEYTPTTEEVKDGYRWLRWDEDFRNHKESSEEFNRWLAEYTRQQREEAYNEGYTEGFDACVDMS